MLPPVMNANLASSLTFGVAKAEWGIVYSGSVIIGAIGEDGRSQVEKLNYGDIW